MGALPLQPVEVFRPAHPYDSTIIGVVRPDSKLDKRPTGCSLPIWLGCSPVGLASCRIAPVGFNADFLASFSCAPASLGGDKKDGVGRGNQTSAPAIAASASKAVSANVTSIVHFMIFPKSDP